MAVDNDFKKAAIDFYNHLNEGDNNRIIFSGIFGVGKTTFLNKLFINHQQDIFGNQKYNVFHLYPVNYSVASNEDIFRYFKYDLIYALIEKGVVFESIDFSYLSELKKFFGKNIHKVLAPLFLSTSVVGKDLLGIYERLDNLKEDFFKQVEDVKQDDGKYFVDYLSAIENNPGLYELDIYTHLINNVLERIKGEGGRKENILIIDDLDRIDPAHIFRLFNVFGAHFDNCQNRKANKFNFDKVIFVCDIENIRNIYRHFYGEGADFSGYVDKFYSKTIYYFENNYALQSLIDGLERRKTKESHVFHALDISFLKVVLSELVQNNLINFRSLTKLEFEKASAYFEFIYQSQDKNRKYFDCLLTKVLILLRYIFGDTSSLLEKLEEIEKNSINFSKAVDLDNAEDVHNYYSCYIFPVLSSDFHKFKNFEAFNFPCEPNGNTVSLQLGLRSENYQVVCTSGGYTKALINFWKDLRKSVELLEGKGVI